MSQATNSGEQISQVDPQEQEYKFLMSALALALLETLRGEEKPKSFRCNRLKNSVETVLRVCDIYLPNGINQQSLNKVWEILDGEVLQVLKTHSTELYAAVSEAAQTTQEATQ